ncbi:MAG TPA: DUF2795 domain-containing protein [Acidimicrobiales bacterium]|nr:DUF2795 domain-containing protein [Acidimicrobiales bacterium]
MVRETKHSPRLDEQLKHEGDAHTREDLLKETAGDGEPDLDLSKRPDLDLRQGLGIDADAAEQRAELARHLTLAHFPADRDALIAVAEADFCPPGLVQRLRSFPAGEQFQNVQAVWAAMGGEVEGRHTVS